MSVKKGMNVGWVVSLDSWILGFSPL